MISNIKTPEQIFAEHKEQSLNTVDRDTSNHILEAWSIHAQNNVNMGLYDQPTCDLCKSEISTALSENTTYIADIEALTTAEEIDAYISNITRTVLTGRV